VRSSQSGHDADREAAPRRTLVETVGGYLGAIGLVGVADLVASWAGPALQGANVVMPFLLSVLAAGAAFGLGPALAAALVAGITYNFFYLEPRLTFRIAHPADLFTFTVFFLVALATGWLAGRARDQALSAASRAESVTTLLEASRALSASSTPDEAAKVLASQIGAATGGAAVVLLPSDGGLRLAAAPAGLEDLAGTSTEAARHAWETGNDTVAPAGGPEVGWDFQPLNGLHGRVGVIGLRRPNVESGSDEAGLLTALLEQGAVALERAVLASAAADNQALRDADRLRSALLSSISHDFRTPLSTVLGSATTLLDYEADLKPAVRRDLLKSIRDDAQRLNRYVGALLDMARLEGGALQPKCDWVDVREVVGSALGRVHGHLGTRKVRRVFERKVSLVKVDPTLLEQAVFNLLENAVGYSEDGSAIEIAVFEDHRNLVISIEDEGPGVPAEAQADVFDKFRRVRTVSDRTGGLGLGLSITKGFIEAMGGRVAVASPVLAGRGARFLISLSKETETPRGLL
jgi:two-component system sensor histidine kinase KdpD